MTYADISIHTEHALGNGDRLARGVTSAVVLTTVLVSGTLSIAWAFALTMVGIYAGLTAIIGEDPFYSLVGHRAEHRPADRPAAGPDTTAHKPDGETGRRSVYKDAA